MLTHTIKKQAAKAVALSLLAASCLWASCGNEEKADVDFSEFEVSMSAPLDKAPDAPACKIDMTVAYASADDSVGIKINKQIAAMLFDMQGLSLRQAADSFASSYTHDYVDYLTPFYKVDVSESWVDAEREKGPTKARYKRTTVIHEDLVKELIAFAEKYGRSESDLLFASFTKGKSSQPYVKNIFQNYFYDALEAMGISKEIRMSRHIDFQSLRHFHDSESKASAERLEPYKAEIRAAIGHKSKTVDELIYTHDTPTSLVTLGVMSKHILDTK